MSRAQTSFALLLLPLLSIAACQRPAPEATTPASDTVVFTGFTLIDGTGRPAAPNSAMTIEDGRIGWVGPAAELKAPAGATTVNLAGKFVMPGLINLHGHVGNVVGLTQDPALYTRETVEHDLKMYASYGVTTMLSLGIDTKDLIFDVRAEQRKGRPTMARVYTAGLGLVYKDGFGGGLTVPGIPTPVIAAASEVDAAVAEQAKKGVDFLKFWTDDAYGSVKRMPADVADAIIKSGHKHGLRVIAHVFYLEDAKSLAASGVDALAHSVRDKLVDQELIDLMKRSGTWLSSASLTRELALRSYATPPPFLNDPFFIRSTTPDVLKTLASPEYQKKMAADKNLSKYPIAEDIEMKNLKTLADAGVRYGFGTDTGVPGRFQGYFEHVELARMVDAGLTPMQALVAATGNAAEFLGAKDLGTLQAGKWADLVVLQRDPLADINNSRTIESVYIAGNKVH
jgi:imidazolonepropionase-like amidohydrolase